MANLLEGWSHESDVARQLGKKLRTLRKWRQLGIGPAWAKNGKTVIYRNAGIPEYFQSQERKPVRNKRGAAS
jgi:hypothetical protein